MKAMDGRFTAMGKNPKLRKKALTGNLQLRNRAVNTMQIN